MLPRLPRGTGLAGCESAGGAASGAPGPFAFALAFAFARLSAIRLPLPLPLPLSVGSPSAPVACTKMPAPGGALGSRLRAGAPWPSETCGSRRFPVILCLRLCSRALGVDGDHLWPCRPQMRIHRASHVIVNRAEVRTNAIFCICVATGHPPKWWQLPRRWVAPRLNDHALTNQRPQVLGPPSSC